MILEVAVVSRLWPCEPVQVPLHDDGAARARVYSPLIDLAWVLLFHPYIELASQLSSVVA